MVELPSQEFKIGRIDISLVFSTWHNLSVFFLLCVCVCVCFFLTSNDSRIGESGLTFDGILNLACVVLWLGLEVTPAWGQEFE